MIIITRVIRFVDVDRFLNRVHAVANKLNEYNFLGMGEFGSYVNYMNRCIQLRNCGASVEAVFEQLVYAVRALYDTCQKMGKHAVFGSVVEVLFTKTDYNINKARVIDACIEELADIVNDIEEYL